MSGIVYYVLDTETTSLNQLFGDLVEISLIRCPDEEYNKDKPIEQQAKPVQISRTIKALNPANASIDSLRITGKTLEDLYNGITLAQAVQEINDFINQDGKTPAHRCIVAHNANFDQKFICHAWQRFGQLFPAEMWLDTLAMSRAYAKKNLGLIKPKVNLAAACDLLQIKKTAKMHNAQDDARNCYKLWKALREKGVDHLEFIKRAVIINEEENLNELIE